MRILTFICTMLVCVACNLGTDQPEQIVATSIPITQVVQNTAIPTTVAAAPTIAPTTIPSTDATPCTIPVDWQPYTVQAGDTLFALSQEVSANVEQIVMANCLDSADNITVGQVIYLPESLASLIPDTEFITYWLSSIDAVNDDSLLIGCESYITPIETSEPRTTNPETNIERALTVLFSANSQDPYRNHWNQGGFAVESVSLSANGTLEVHISGDFLLQGTCTDPEIVAQILLIVFTEPEVEAALIYVGDENLRQISDMSGLSGPNSVFTEDNIPILHR